MLVLNLYTLTLHQKFTMDWIKDLDGLKNRTVLVTGCCGTIGSSMISRLTSSKDYSPSKIIGIDNNENALFLQGQRNLDQRNLNFYLADVLNKELLQKLFEGVDVVFHCAAHKHVPLCEDAPEQALLTNIEGLKNVLNAADRAAVKTLIFASSDKAVNPTSVMGATKLLGERLVTQYNRGVADSVCQTRFSSTRFGNVLGSSGSVFEVFYNQIKNGGPVTLTSDRMTRFVMSAAEATSLLIESAIMARGGEVFITKMPTIRISDLASVMIDALAPRFGFDPSKIEIREVGPRPSEKYYEELMSESEITRAYELENYFAVLPLNSEIKNSSSDDELIVGLDKPYNSSHEKPLEYEELRLLMQNYGLLMPLS